MVPPGRPETLWDDRTLRLPKGSLRDRRGPYGGSRRDPYGNLVGWVSLWEQPKPDCRPEDEPEGLDHRIPSVSRSDTQMGIKSLSSWVLSGKAPMGDHLGSLWDPGASPSGPLWGTSGCGPPSAAEPSGSPRPLLGLFASEALLSPNLSAEPREGSADPRSWYVSLVVPEGRKPLFGVAFLSIYDR